MVYGAGAKTGGAVPVRDQVYMTKSEFDHAERRWLSDSESSRPTTIFLYAQPTTSTLERWLMYEAEVNRRLVRALEGCKHYLDYIGHYIAFLLGQISEPEFEEISKRYVVRASIPQSELVKMVQVLHHTTGSLFSSDELAAILLAPRAQVDAALMQLREQPQLPRSDGS